MPTRRIKESYGPPVVPKDATPQQRQAILQEHRKHIDFVKQLNDLRATQDDEIAGVQANIDAQVEIGRVVAMARLTTNGGGGFTINITRGCTATIVATVPPRIRLTFSEPRPTINGNPHYTVSTVQIGVGARTQNVTSYTAAVCDLVLRDAAGELNPATSSQALAVTITDFD